MRLHLVVPAATILALSLASCTSNSGKVEAPCPTPAVTAAATPVSTASVEAALKTLIAERDAALKAGNTAKLETIYADDYMSTGPTGVSRTKALVMEDFKSGVLKVESISSDDIRIRVHGDTAIATGVNTMKGTDRGRVMGGQNRFTQVWVKGTDGSWRIAAFQLTPVAAPR